MLRHSKKGSKSWPKMIKKCSEIAIKECYALGNHNSPLEIQGLFLLEQHFALYIKWLH
eukprot:m.17317 g.17317  ORF g.17317 m.17317 type:complete len:58 (+) comp5982_c0_seq2:1702-1875(+)